MQCSQCQNVIQGKLYWQKFCRECAIKKAENAHLQEWLILTNDALPKLKRR